MPFAELSKYLEKLERTSSRLEITKILAEMVGRLKTEEIAEGVFLSLGTVGPSYEKVEFGVSEKLMVRIIARSFDLENEAVIKKFKKKGDLGEVAQELNAKIKNQKSKFSVGEIYRRLKEIVETAGAGSVERKIQLMSDLLRGLDPLSVRYVVRIPLGTMRLGFSEKTVLEALVLLHSGETRASFAKSSKSRSIKSALEIKYNVYPNIGEIAEIFRSKGLKGLSGVKVKVGTPVMPQLCARLETVEEMVEKVGGSSGSIAAEYKYDGIRLQIHLNRSAQNKLSKLNPPASGQNLVLGGFDQNPEDKGDPRVKMYTRNFEQMQSVFPDLTEGLLKAVRAEEAIIDGEAVGFDPKSGRFIPFQETIQRKRKYHVAEMVDRIPVKYFAFDILYKEGKDLSELPYLKRREILKKVIGENESILVSQSFFTSDPSQLQDYFKEAKKKGLEGLIVKNPISPYEAGNRGFSWVKFKREDDGTLTDTIDCVVLGYNAGTGKRSDFGIGAFLVGIYDSNSDQYLTIAKIGTGLTDSGWTELKTQISKLKTKEIPKNVEIRKELVPDVLAKPEIIVQIRADEITVSPSHSSGYALRFPRMMGYRSDKSAKQATTLTEIKQLYKLQEGK